MSAEEGTASLSDDDETQTAANGEVGGSPPPAAPQPQMVLVERLSGRGGRPREIVVGTTAVLIGRSMPALEKRQTQLAAKGTECEVCHLTQPPSVSSCHAWIFFEEREQRFYVNDLKSANGTFCTSPAQYKLKTRTFVGDRKHASPAPVEIGENYILEFADVRFQVKEITGIVRPANPLDLSDEDSWEGGDTKTADPSTDVVLMVVAGPGRGEYRVVRATQPVMIGRLPDSAREASQTDLVVVDPKKSLSRKHARVYYAEDSHCYKIETLGKHPAFISTQMVGISLDDSFDVSKISSWRLCQEGFPEPLEYGNLIRCGSVVIQVRNHAGPPAKMMPPSCQDRQETSLTLSWQEGWCATDILGYVLQMSKDNCASWIAVFGSANKGHTVSDLEPGKTYHFRVRACSAGGPSEWSNPIAYTTAHPAPVDSEFVVTGEVIKGKKLGEGQFGRVYVGVVGETAVAVKEADIFPPDEDADAAQDEFLASFEAEIALLKTLYHRHIVRFLGSQTIDAGTHRVVRIFLEYFPVGSLKNWLRKVGGKLNEDITRRYTKQILTGLAYIHAHNIMHRDIKSDNILLKVTGDGKQEVALADFGCSELVNKLKGETDLAGTIHYMAPEVFKEEADFKSDIWSVGCTVIEMLTGVPPWHDLDELGFTGQVLSLGRNFSPGTAVQTTPPLPAGVSEFCTDFLQSCFRLDPEERPTAQELLAHPWLTMVSASASGIRRGSDVVLSPTGAAADRAMAASSASAPATTSTASPAAAATTPEPATAATPEAVNYQVPPGGGVTATATGASEFPDTPPTTDRIPAPRLVGEAAATGSFSPMATPTLKVNESAALSAALAAGREVAAAPEPTEANADADAGAGAGVEAGDGGGPSSAAGETDGLDETQPIVS